MVPALLLGVVLAGGPSWDQGRSKSGEPDNLAHPEIPHDTWTGRRYVGGGVTVTYRFYWSYIMEGEYPFDSTCTLACRGQKHLLHQQCDTSCDSACTNLHQLEIKPEFYVAPPGGAGQPTWGQQLSRDIGKAGGRATQAGHVVTAISNTAMKPIQDKIDDYTYKYKSGHWNEHPCSSSDRKFHFSDYTLFASYDVVKDGRTVATLDTRLGTVKIPEQAFQEKDPVENCACQIVREQRNALGTGGSLVPAPSGTWTHGMMLPSGTTKGLKVGGLFLDNEGDEKYAAVPGMGSERLGVTATVSLRDLNNYTISVQNTTPQPVGVALTPGATFRPRGDGFQNMVNLDFLQWTVPAFSAIEMPVRAGPAWLPEPQKGYMACLDMAKHEPDGKMAYSIEPSSDATLSKIAFDVAQQRFRGPWNQAQLWVYRDGASIDQINERLGIGVSTSHYLVGLFDLAHKYGVPLDETKYKAVWDPKLLLAHAAEADQVEWLVQELTRHDARGLASWVRKNLAAFAPLFEPGGEEWYVPHAAHVATSLCGSASADVQAAGLEFLEKGVPAAARSRMLEAGGLDGLVQLAWGDGPLKKRALAVAGSFDPQLAKDLQTPGDPDAPLPELKPPPGRR